MSFANHCEGIGETMEEATDRSTEVEWDIDPFDEQVLLDPSDYYRDLTSKAPFVHLSHYGVWATGRYEEIHTIFRDWRQFCSARGVGIHDFKTQKPWRKPSLVLEVDPPEHSKRRNVIAKILTPKAIAGLREKTERQARELVARVLEKKSVDAYDDIAAAFPLQVFPDFVGLRQDGRSNLLKYGSMVFNSLGPRNAVYHRAMENSDSVTDWIAASCKRDKLSPQGFGADLYAAADSGRVSHEDAEMLVRSLLSAGVDTTVNAIGNALYCFATNPDQWDLLVRDPSLAKNAFEEVLRFESPVHSFFRTVNTDVSISGKDLREGDKILLCMAAANRDPRKWENPDKFDIQRDASGHLSFGVGIHVCVGQSIARLEAVSLLTALAEQVARIELRGEPKFEAGNALHGLRSMPIELISR